MSRDLINKINSLENRINYSSPDKVAGIVKKLVKAKDIFINGK